MDICFIIKNNIKTGTKAYCVKLSQKKKIRIVLNKFSIALRAFFSGV